MLYKVLKQRGSYPVADMNKRGHGSAPEGGGHARLVQHRDNTFFYRPVGPLRHTILLGSVSNSMLPLNAMINAECFKLLRYVFSTLIIAQGAHPLASEVLSPCLELLEHTKDL
jgi:hypothetical protein